MEIVSAIISPVVESLMGPIKRHLGYLFSSAENVRYMKDLMDQLDGKKADATTHKDKNERNTLEVPARVEGWLEDVEKIKIQAESISSNNIGCCNLIAKYQVGRKSLKTTLVIERLHKEEFEWTDASKALGRVDTKMASTSEPSRSDIGHGFRSRDKTFKDALEYLKEDNDTQVIALCGMGGVGKTTMMEQLKKVVEANEMFKWVMKVDIGRDYTAASFLHAIEAHFSIPLSNEVEAAKVVRLHKMFEKISEKERTLIILDDVWGEVQLEDVGLRPLPKGFKLFLTSRDTTICRKFAIKAGLRLKVLEVNVLEEKEAHEFLLQITNMPEEYDLERYQIGVEIVKKCSYLPLAIKLIAATLIDEDKAQWRDALISLKEDADIQEIVNKSYISLKNKDCKEILLLCGLFPEDSNISIEDLTRYAWGLKLLNGVSKFGAARDRIEARVSDLKKAHLLIDGDYRGHVKLHDIVLDFVLATISDGDRVSLVKHGDISELSDDEMNKPYKRMSLSGEGRWEFLEGIKSPNLLLLSLMKDGYNKMSSPEGFYENMKNLEVISFQSIDDTSVLKSLQCSINLRTLRLNYCSVDDYSSIGNLSKLEVLSISSSRLHNLPTSFGNFKKLKVLDLNGCPHLCIGDGVLKNFDQLEEFYMGDAGFSVGNSRELKVRSKDLTALEIRCYKNEGQMSNMSYENLRKFKIYMGQWLYLQDDYESTMFWGNTLSLVISKAEFLKSGMNVLLRLTEMLLLQVDGMSNLEDIEGKSLPQYSSFCNLRILKVCDCVDLKYVFTLRVATALLELERLEISLCDSMEELIYGSGSQMVAFPKLKILSLEKLPNLLCLCNNEIFGTQRINNNGGCGTSLNEGKGVVGTIMEIPGLKSINVPWLPNLKELRISGCDSLQHVFTFATLESLGQLCTLIIEDCMVMDVILKEETEDQTRKHVEFPCLKYIHLKNLQSLKGFFLGMNKFKLPLLDQLGIDNCPQMTVFTVGCLEAPNLNNLRRGTDIYSVECVGNIHKTPCSTSDHTCSHLTTSQGIHMSPSELIHMVKIDHHIETVIPHDELLQVRKLEMIQVEGCDSVKDVFEVLEGNDSDVEIPKLKKVELWGLQRLEYLWKSNQRMILKFPSLTKLTIKGCPSIEHVFTTSMVGSLLQLQELSIQSCKNMEVIVKEESMVHEKKEEYDAKVNNEITLTHLKSLTLYNLPSLKGFCLGKEAFSWPLLDYLQIEHCHGLTVFTNGHLTTPRLNVIHTSAEHSVPSKDPNSFIETMPEEEFHRC